MSRTIAGLLNPDFDAGLEPDVAICSACGWRGPARECEKGQDGDWETGYFQVDLCPLCEDGGCIDDYEYSREREQIKETL